MDTSNIKIYHLPKKPEYIKTVSNWIYNEFADKEKISLEEITDKLSNRFIDKLPITIIAVDNDKGCIGTVSLFENDLRTRKDFTPWLASLYVKKAHRNQSVGKILINELIKITKGLDYTKIFLRTETASQYYFKNNWVMLEDTVDENSKSTTVFYKEIQKT
ncbi:MAG TPA: GNAT family N-acetyltransferase [Victivallales bacterium]|nr:GNAT family N-acetyltransferase [Victivallales bacterium]